MRSPARAAHLRVARVTHHSSVPRPAAGASAPSLSRGACVPFELGTSEKRWKSEGEVVGEPRGPRGRGAEGMAPLSWGRLILVSSDGYCPIRRWYFPSSIIKVLEVESLPRRLVRSNPVPVFFPALHQRSLSHCQLWMLTFVLFFF